jgi:Omp85 superfamily domain
MRMLRLRGWATGGNGVVMAVIFGASSALAQSPARLATGSQTVSVRASTAYERGRLGRTLFGDEWRDVWSAQITVPVLDLGSYAGGLTPFKAGGNQSKTLRLHGADGRTYVFRSAAKNVQKAMPDDLRDTPVGAVVQDQTAAFHPTCHLAVAVLQDAVGLLQAPPMLVFMPDDPRLGEYRSEFANVLGQIEERPDEAENGTTFANAEKIIGTDKMLEHLDESMEDRLDSRDYLTARFIDFVVGDTDRGADQWRFAKFERGERDIYRTIPRDHDFAFMKVEGLLMGFSGSVHPRLVHFGEHYPDPKSLLYMTEEFDRSQLVDVAWADWDAVTTSVQQRLTNEVIDHAVMQLPEAHRQQSGTAIAAGLRARRDTLPAIAREFYLLVNREAEIYGSDEAERAEIDRFSDGSVNVRVWRAGAGGTSDAKGALSPAFERRFLPAETREIRVHLERGNDRAVVRGDADRSITVRVIGGEGDDVLEDSSRVASGAATHFYDASGRNTFVRGARTRVATKPFVTIPPKRSVDDEDEDKPEEHPRVLSEERRGRFRDLMPDSDDFIESKTSAGIRYWGKSSGWTPFAGYRESGGVVVGAGPAVTNYGFRRRPYAWRAGVWGMVGTRSGDLGIRLTADRYLENSPWSISLFAHATQLESNRFYGYGNDTERVDPSLSLITRGEVLVLPSLRYSFSMTSALAFGPVVKYVDPEIPSGSPAEFAEPPGSAPFGQVGVRADLTIDKTTVMAARQSGFGLQAGVSEYPAVWDAKESFGEAHALARLFIPLGWPTLALRAGGQRSWGDFPLHESAFIGGRWSLRGFRWNRFAGDASAFGSVELRAPLVRITLLVRGQLGIVGFADVGRVWMDGNSAGDWHTGAGSGLWFGSLGQQVSATYARGDEHRVYFYYGMPF